jgi:hypothetical protein
MRSVLLSALLIVGLPAFAHADATSDVVKIFGRDPGTGAAHACFIRRYTKAHLASHPKQNVTDMLLYVNKQEGTDLYYSLNMQVNFRQLKKPFQVAGSCSQGSDGRHALSCGIDCDGGSLAVRVKNETSVLVDIPDSVRVYDPSSSDDAPDADLPKGARFGEDDKLFRLDRTALKDCAPVIFDEDVKTKVLQGVTTQ